MTKHQLTPKDISLMVKMRAIGYTQKEIATELNVSQTAIQYRFRRIYQRARKEGIDNTLLRLLTGDKLALCLFLEQLYAIKK